MEYFEKLDVIEWKFSGFPEISTKRLDESMHNVNQWCYDKEVVQMAVAAPVTT